MSHFKRSVVLFCSYNYKTLPFAAYRAHCTKYHVYIVLNLNNLASCSHEN